MMKTTQLTVRGLLVSLCQRDETLQTERRLLVEKLERLDHKIQANRHDIERVQLTMHMTAVKQDGVWTTR